MTREVADVFVVMKGEVPDSIFKVNNTTTGLDTARQRLVTNSKNETPTIRHNYDEWVR